MSINIIAMQMAEKALEQLPVRHRAGEWISKYHVRNLLYGVFVSVNKNIDNIDGLQSQLRDATDLLNDCGYYLNNGCWEDSENPIEGEEE